VSPLAVAAAGRASLLATALKSAGSATLTVGCATSPCNGTVTLVAMIPGKGKHGAKGRARATVVGSAGFSLAAGSRRSVSVSLSGAARALLAKSHRLQVTVRIVTRNSAGAQASSTSTTTLNLPAKKKSARRR
jgi:hypothetical protein